MNKEFLKMQKIAGLITENQFKQLNENENKTALELFQMFKDEDLLNDRREYDVEDLMSAYPDLSEEEAEKLFQMLNKYSDFRGNLPDDEDDYNYDEFGHYDNPQQGWNIDDEF